MFISTVGHVEEELPYQEIVFGSPVSTTLNPAGVLPPCRILDGQFGCMRFDTLD